MTARRPMPSKCSMLLLACLGFATAAAAAPKDATLDACLAKADGVTVAMHDCYAAGYARVDARLNAVYRRALGGMTPALQMRLVAAQRAWVTFRDLDCRIPAEREAGGSMAPLIVDDCAIGHTLARIDELTDVASANSK